MEDKVVSGAETANGTVVSPVEPQKEVETNKQVEQVAHVAVSPRNGGPNAEGAPKSTETKSSSLEGKTANEILFVGNFKKFYEKAVEDFRVALDPSEMLILATRDIKLAAEGSANLADARKALLLESAVSKMVGAIIYRNELSADPEIGLCVCNFFMAVMDLLIPKSATTDSEDDVMTLFKLLNAELRFYTDHVDQGGAIKKFLLSKNGEEKQDFIEKGGPMISPFLIRCINHFCDIKGFELFTERISKTNPRPPLPVMRLMVKTLLKIAPWVKSSFLKERLTKLKEPCLEQLAYYTENRTHDQGVQYDGTSDAAATLLQLCFSEADLEQEFLEFQLKGALGNIRSAVLERRLHGVRYVNSVVKRAQKWIEKENTGRMARFANWLKMDDNEEMEVVVNDAGARVLRKPKPIKPLDPKRVVTWLSENKVLDELLQSNAHEAIVKQGIPILAFLASCDPSLDMTKYISLMWEISLDQHESVRNIIFSSIVHLAENLSLADTEFTYSLLKKLPLEKYDDQTLEFLRNFSTNANAKFGKESKKFFGLDIYWALFQDNDKVPVDVQKRASAHFAAVLESESCQSLVQTYLEMIVGVIGEGHSLGQSLKLFCRLCGIQEHRKKKRTVETIDEKMHVMQGVFDAIVKYKQTVEKEGGVKAPEAHRALYGRRYTHVQLVEIIFEWFEWILAHSSLTLTMEQVDVLWKLFVEQQSPAESNIFFTWIAHDDEKVGYSLNDQVVAHILEQRMLGSPTFCSSLSLLGYKAFRKFFLAHNVKVGSIKKLSASPERYTVAGNAQPVVGLDSLWSIALDGSSDVSPSAAELLNDLFLFPHARGHGVREGHVKRCMQAVKSSKDGARLLRSLRLLSDMNEAYEKGLGRKTSTEKSASSAGRITLFIKVDANGFVLTDVDPSTTIDQLKKMIGDRLGGMSGVFMRVFLEDKELSSGKQSLSSYRVVDKAELIIRQNATAGSKDEIGVDALGGMFVQAILKGLGLRPAAPSTASLGLPQGPATDAPVISGIASRNTEATQPATQDVFGEMPPALIMSQQEHFDTIYSLLTNKEAPVVAAAWLLLDHLPMAPELRQAFSTKSPKFEELLPLDSGYRLVYALQVFESLCSAKSWPSAKEGSSWRTQVVESGVLSVLSSIIHHYSSVAQQDVSSATVRLLAVRVVLALVQDEDVRKHAEVSACAAACAEALRCVANAKVASPEDVELSGRVADVWRIVGGVVKSENLTAWIRETLVEAPSKEVRSNAQRCASFLKSLDQLLPVLIELLPDANKWEHRSVQLLSLLEQIARRENGPSTVWASVGNVVAQLIRQRPIVEDSTEVGREDLGLASMMTLLAVILSRNPELKKALGSDFVGHIFHECLFALPNESEIMERLQPPKCKTDFTRQAALKLLTELCRDCVSNFMVVSKFLWTQGLELVEKHRTKGDSAGANVAANGKPRGPKALLDLRPDGGFSTAMASWSLSPSGDLKAHSNFVGLQNLGATCYMNSLLQQLFFAPKFADAVFAAPVIQLHELMGLSAPPAAAAPSSQETPTTSPAVEDKDGEEKEPEAPVDPDAEHLLIQLQRLFCNLRYTNKKYSPTRSFALANKDMDGNTINTGTQQDAKEYFESLFARLEFFCGKNKRDHQFLKDVFGGTLSNQLICKDGCTHTKSNPELFYALSVDIKNKPNLLKALELYVQGEMLEGDNAFRCDPCNAKRPTLKRAVLDSLPNVLMIHLKRFEFSYETLTSSKLNQYFEFPEELDLYPYTVEGIQALDPAAALPKPKPDDYYRYRLRGVVIHSGGASAGHYYSLIRNEAGGWNEFNDSTVRAFDFANMKEEAFGGTFTRVVRDENGYEKTVSRERMHNAYLLVYERVKEFPWVEQDASAGEVSPPNDVKPLVEKVFQENVSNLQGRYLSSPQYYNWLWDLLNLYSTDDTTDAYRETLSLAMFLVLHVMGRTRDAVMGSIWSGHLGRLITTSKFACDWFFRRLLEGQLDDNAPPTPRFHYLYDFLVRCPRARTRVALIEMLEAGVARVSKDAKWTVPAKVTHLSSDSAVPEAELTKFLMSAPAHVVLADRMLVEIPALIGHSLQHMQHWFKALKVFSEAGDTERQYLIARGAVEYLLDLLFLKGKFNLSKGSLALPEISSIQRNLKNVSHALGCVVNVVRGSNPPTEAQLFELATAVEMKMSQPKKKAGTAAPPAARQKNPLHRGTVLQELPPTVWKELIGREPIHKLCNDRMALAELSELLEYLSWEDGNATEYFVFVLSDGLKKTKTVESVGGYLTCLEALLVVNDSLVAARTRTIGSLVMLMMDRAIRMKTKAVAGAEVTRYQGMLVAVAKGCSPTHPLRKFVLSKEREMNDFRAEVGLKPIDLEGV